MPQGGERYIIVEKGKPSLVVMSFEDYQKIKGNPCGKKREEGEEEEAAFEIEGEPFAISEEEEPIGQGPEEPSSAEAVGSDRIVAAEQDFSLVDDSERQEVEALKEELNRELTLEDLPF